MEAKRWRDEKANKARNENVGEKKEGCNRKKEREMRRKNKKMWKERGA